MSIRLLYGKPVADTIYETIRTEISHLSHPAKLSVILVGDNPASLAYVTIKNKKCLELGFQSEIIRLPKSISEQELIQQIVQLNNDKEVKGILVQLPLPSHISSQKVIRTISPRKDVDGLHPMNSGLLYQGTPLLAPCTALGIMALLKFYQIPVMGKKVVVVGRSEIVGKPTALMLQKENATVTVCHSKTQHLHEETKRAEILIVAAGVPNLIGKDSISEGCVIIDVGMNRINQKLCGDVDIKSVSEKASAITPVPGGVGPMTVAMLMRNLLTAANS